jgi:hypothetical protein
MILDAEREDLVTDKEFENFDLKFEWKISKKEIAVFFSTLSKEDIPKAWASYPEYQLLEKHTMIMPSVLKNVQVVCMGFMNKLILPLINP